MEENEKVRESMSKRERREEEDERKRVNKLVI
jgi:hypothetical protein